MRLTSRLGAPLIAGVAAVSLAVAFYQTQLESRNMRRDLQQHALILGDSLARSAEPLVVTRATDQLQRLVESFRDRETVTGVLVYNAAGEPLAATTGLISMLGPPTQAVLRALHSGQTDEQFLTAAGWPLHIAAIP